ncbi:hypothetical protein K2173_002490 [Erythroxylum novogranatense]|uniref:Uncharacterized protein n=1 Tax=Erythroxylum novogranatense TaxID=1862640 RepID=A0AAV8TQP3_9ROSI|nr:hypothetical protein K2173_002490 [Erythroxylum novogranatense]
MDPKEKRRKLHEALLNTLYPPSPPPPSQALGENAQETESLSREGFDVNLIPDDYGLREGSSSTSNDNDDDCGLQKLTRAQRKRLRKKKLKEDVCRRNQIIGPLLPPSMDASSSVNIAVEESTPGVRQNADDSHASTIIGESCGGSNQNKRRQRRMAKKLAKEKLEFSNVENCVKDQNLKCPNLEANDSDHSCNAQSSQGLQSPSCQRS